VSAIDFPEYLQRAMSAAGYPRPVDVERGTNGEVAQGVVGRWLAGKGESPTISKLRPVANLLGITLAEMMVSAGLVEPYEVGLEEDPIPPKARTIEDEIRSDPRLRDDRKEALIRLLESLREEHTSRTPVRARRTHVSPDQGIDTDGNEELSG
jgi:transcriptional regulator with XRE-family HTH domain